MVQRELPSGRYGKRAGRRTPRWAVGLLLAVAVVVGAIVTVVGYRNLGAQPIEGKQTSFRVLDDSAVEITFEVVRDEPSQAAVCIVRARSEDGDEAGRKEVFVAPAGETVTQKTVLRTSKRPVTGEVFGCSYQVPPYLTSGKRPSG